MADRLDIAKFKQEQGLLKGKGLPSQALAEGKSQRQPRQPRNYRARSRVLANTCELWGHQGL